MKLFLAAALVALLSACMGPNTSGDIQDDDQSFGAEPTDGTPS